MEYRIFETTKRDMAARFHIDWSASTPEFLTIRSEPDGQFVFSNRDEIIEEEEGLLKEDQYLFYDCDKIHDLRTRHMDIISEGKLHWMKERIAQRPKLDNDRPIKGK